MTATTFKKNRPVDYLAGKPMILHLLCCQGFEVIYYTLGRLVVVKRKSRRRGSCSILDFCNNRVNPRNLSDILALSYTFLMIPTNCTDYEGLKATIS
jgi:hypothetical protein